MPMYRVKFRADKEDQLIEAKMMGNSGTSYVFFDNKDIVAQVPKDAVLSVVKEKADAKVTDHRPGNSNRPTTETAKQCVEELISRSKEELRSLIELSPRAIRTNFDGVSHRDRVHTIPHTAKADVAVRGHNTQFQ